MPFNLKVSGVWKSAVPYLRVSGVWKTCTAHLKVSGVWKVVTALFSPPGGNYSNSTANGTPATVILTCSVAATWTWTVRGGGSPGGSVSQASGYVGTSIQFSQAPGGISGNVRTNIWDVTGTVSGYPAEVFVVQCDAEQP